MEARQTTTSRVSEFILFSPNKVTIAARIAEVKDMDLDKTFQAMKTIADHVIVSNEMSKTGKQHQHLFLCSEHLCEDDVKNKIKEVYNDAKGIKHIYVKKALKPRQLLKYTLKEGEFLVHGIDKKLIEDFFKLSKSKEGMTEKFQKIEEELILKKISFEQFQRQYVQLKVDHGQPLYDNHIIAYFKRIGLQVGEISLTNYVSRLNDRIEMDMIRSD